MTCRGLNLDSDIDKITNASEEEIDVVVKKFMATKNCTKASALGWAMFRAVDEETINKITRKLEEY